MTPRQLRQYWRSYRTGHRTRRHKREGCVRLQSRNSGRYGRGMCLQSVGGWWHWYTGYCYVVEISWALSGQIRFWGHIFLFFVVEIWFTCVLMYNLEKKVSCKFLVFRTENETCRENKGFGGVCGKCISSVSIFRMNSKQLSVCSLNFILHFENKTGVFMNFLQIRRVGFFFIGNVSMDNHWHFYANCLSFF